MKRLRQSAPWAVILLTVAGATHAQQLRVRGDRLTTRAHLPERNPGLSHALSQSIQDSPIGRATLNVIQLPRGTPAFLPVILDDNRLILTTHAPPAIWWTQGDRVTHGAIGRARLVGPPAIGADLRVLTVDDNSHLTVYTPEGEARQTLMLPSRPLGGVTTLGDGTVLVPTEIDSTRGLFALTPDLQSGTPLTLPFALNDAMLLRGYGGSVWASTTRGPLQIRSDRGIHPLPANAPRGRLLQLEEDTLVVLSAAQPTFEITTLSRHGAVRGSQTAQGTAFSLPMGHLAVAHGVIPTPAAPVAGSTPAPPPPPPPAPVVRSRWRLGALARGEPEPTHTELTVYDRTGRRQRQVLLPRQESNEELRWILMDPEQSLLVMTSRGRLFAIDPSGAMRWEVNLSITPVFDAVTLADGGFAFMIQAPRPALVIYHPAAQAPPHVPTPVS
ncbi:MAG: hypothetical protein Q8Q09_05480 [Deltaproteobacteria bacterium]|nr:hypothetical protein [Deltaproteobacteria bacterium]